MKNPETTNTTATIAIADAARALRRSYNQTLRLYLIGRLDGERRGGRLFLTPESVERERVVTATAPTGAVPGGSAT